MGCSASGRDPVASGGSPDGGPGGNGDTVVGPDGTTGKDGGPPTTTTTTSIIYANTDDSLYELDPTNDNLTLIGTFDGANGNVTDCAVNADGDVYVNTSDTIYKASLPASGKGKVTLDKVATIAKDTTNQRFYALAFAPAGVLGAGEGLVGGDGDGKLWSIDPQSGATKSLGSFGRDGSTATFALSGDLVFYVDANQKPTGLATIRSCKGSTCTTTNDYLAGIDMTALAAAFTSGKPATSLLSGIYGGSSSGKGAGVGAGELFGLGAWEGKVYGFQRASAAVSGEPELLSVDTKTGRGKTLPKSFSFTNGWSGACVSTKVSVTVAPPPEVPK
ncbi:MAG: hypothetical protein U0235_07730 [Polyangiaceae bacterium]